MRVAAFDIGTNSVLLLVADVNGGRLEPVHDTSIISRLGQGVDENRQLSDAAVERTVAALQQLRQKADELQAERIAAIATSAVRVADNGDSFLAKAQAVLGAEVQVLSGEEEAQLSWLSISEDSSLNLAYPSLMVDLGGGSTEFVLGDKSSSRVLASVEMGAVRLTERHLTHDCPSEEEMQAAAADAKAAYKPVLASIACKSVVAIGGTAVNIACIKSLDPCGGIHGGTITLPVLQRCRRNLARMPLEERRQVTGLEPSRADIIVAGCVLLETMLEFVDAAELTVSTRGARFGLAMRMAAS